MPCIACSPSPCPYLHFAADALSAPGTADQNYYPESLYKLFVVNTPAVITVAWKLISPWVDSRTKAKIVFLKPHETAAELLKHINDDDLPVELGGKCACEGGCLMDGMAEEDHGFTCVPIEVKKGAKFSMPVAVPANHTICWEFIIDGHDIGFCVMADGANIAPGALWREFQ